MNIKKSLIIKIKQKPELAGISDAIIKQALEFYIKKNKIPLVKISSKNKKIIVKDVRRELRLYSGRFSISKLKSGDLLKQNKIKKLLKTHSATRERLEFYPELKTLIKNLNPESILDLGCGINPIALANKKIRYYACDINETDLSLIMQYFRRNKIAGKVFVCDLRNPECYKNLPEADLCLLLKLFDVLERKGHKLAEKIILSLKCRYFLVSFPTKTLTNKPMKHPQRGWIGRLLTRLEYKFKLIKSKNEIFYLAEKS